MGRLAAATLVLVLTGCSFTDVAFRQDTRLDFVSPEDRAAVTLPATVDWDFAGDDDTTFAVFLDRRPPPPGRTLASIADGDDTCERDPGCPDDDYLADRGVWTTTDTSFTFEAIRRPTRDDRRELHEVTVILVDGEGRRIGESAWILEFEVDREVASGGGA